MPNKTSFMNIRASGGSARPIEVITTEASDARIRHAAEVAAAQRKLEEAKSSAAKSIMSSLIRGIIQGSHTSEPWKRLEIAKELGLLSRAIAEEELAFPEQHLTAMEARRAQSAQRYIQRLSAAIAQEVAGANRQSEIRSAQQELVWQKVQLPAPGAGPLGRSVCEW